MPLKKSSRIYIAGHCGMVGSAVKRHLENYGCTNIITSTRAELDLRNKETVEAFIRDYQPDIVIDAAAKVGGIHANNTYPAEFIYDNLITVTNLIHAAYISGTKRFLFLGSSCIYPREAPQPMPEDCLLTGPLEKTNEAYAVAKIAGLKLCEYYRKQYKVLYHCVMPTNLYGPHDHYHPENAHVLPALIRRIHEAKEGQAESVTIWGTGEAKREFLHVDDLARAVQFILEEESPPDWVNIGTGEDVTILELAQMIQAVVGYKGKILNDPSKPDGTPRKLLDVSKIKQLGWSPKYDLKSGLEHTYRCFLDELNEGSLRM